MIEDRRNIIPMPLFAGFCAAELLVLIALKLVQAVDRVALSATFLMFGAILLNALFMLFLVTRVKRAGKGMALAGIPLAVFLTLLADVFLVLAYDLSAAGLIHFIAPLTANMIGFLVFGLVQVTYACYLGLTKLRLGIRIGFYLALIGLIFALDLFSWDRLIACLSMSQLVLNLIFGWIEHKRRRTVTSLLFALGITLFMGCDGLIMVRMLLPEEGLVYAIVFFMVWVFYIPSQVLLTAGYLTDRTTAA